MIIIAVLAAGVFAALVVGTPPGRRRRLTATALDRAAPRSSVSRPQLTMIIMLVTVPVIAGLVDGAQGWWCATAAVIVAATMIILLRRGARRRAAARRRRDVAHACTVLAGQVRIGQVPLTALRSAAEDCPVLTASVATADLGGDVTAQWRRQARVPGQQGLTALAAAWQLAESAGAGMAPVVDQVADALHEDEALSLVISSEAAAPRASGKIMAVLPLVGLALGYLIGGDPVRFLLGSPAGWACLVTGATLSCGGVLWMDAVADRAGAEL